MMNLLSYELFFDLSSFDHHALFQKDKPVWQALHDLKAYLDQLSLGKIESDIPDSVTLVHPEKIQIGKGVKVGPGAYIEGPCVIGDHSIVGHTAYLRPYVLTGVGCVIGHATEAKHAIFLNNAKAPHFNYVGDSILGNKTNLGAGSICANVRLDKKSVSVTVDNERFSTGLKKMGAIVGDGSEVGCNAVLNPGLLLKKRSFIRASVAQVKSTLSLKKVTHV